MPISLADGREFVESPWQDVPLNIVPHHVEFVAECAACGHAVEVERKHLAPAGRSHQFKISEISKRLKCSGCGAKRASLRLGWIKAEVR